METEARHSAGGISHSRSRSPVLRTGRAPKAKSTKNNNKKDKKALANAAAVRGQCVGCDALASDVKWAEYSGGFSHAGAGLGDPIGDACAKCDDILKDGAFDLEHGTLAEVRLKRSQNEIVDQEWKASAEAHEAAQMTLWPAQVEQGDCKGVRTCEVAKGMRAGDYEETFKETIQTAGRSLQDCPGVHGWFKGVVVPDRYDVFPGVRYEQFREVNAIKTVNRMPRQLREKQSDVTYDYLMKPSGLEPKEMKILRNSKASTENENNMAHMLVQLAALRDRGAAGMIPHASKNNDPADNTSLVSTGLPDRSIAPEPSSSSKSLNAESLRALDANTSGLRRTGSMLNEALTRNAKKSKPASSPPKTIVNHRVGGRGATGKSTVSKAAGGGQSWRDCSASQTPDMSDTDMKTAYKVNAVDINQALKNIPQGHGIRRLREWETELVEMERDDPDRDERDNKAACAQRLKAAAASEKLSKYNPGDNVDHEQMDTDIAELLVEHAGDVPMEFNMKMIHRRAIRDVSRRADDCNMTWLHNVLLAIACWRYGSESPKCDDAMLSVEQQLKRQFDILKPQLSMLKDEEILGKSKQLWSRELVVKYLLSPLVKDAFNHPENTKKEMACLTEMVKTNAEVAEADLDVICDIKLCLKAMSFCMDPTRTDFEKSCRWVLEKHGDEMKRKFAAILLSDPNFGPILKEASQKALTHEAAMQKMQQTLEELQSGKAAGLVKMKQAIDEHDLLTKESRKNSCSELTAFLVSSSTRLAQMGVEKVLEAIDEPGQADGLLARKLEAAKKLENVLIATKKAKFAQGPLAEACEARCTALAQELLDIQSQVGDENFVPELKTMTREKLEDGEKVKSLTEQAKFLNDVRNPDKPVPSDTEKACHLVFAMVIDKLVGTINCYDQQYQALLDLSEALMECAQMVPKWKSWVDLLAHAKSTAHQLVLYNETGSTAEERVAKDNHRHGVLSLKSQQKALMEMTATCKDTRFNRDVACWAGVEDLRSRLDTAITESGDCHVQSSVKGVNAAMVPELVRKAGGLTEGKVWHQALTEDARMKTILKAGGKMMHKAFDQPGFKRMTLELRSAIDQCKHVHDIFEKDPEEQWWQGAVGLYKKACGTAMAGRLLQKLNDKALSKPKIKTAIDKMSQEAKDDAYPYYDQLPECVKRVVVIASDMEDID